MRVRGTGIRLKVETRGLFSFELGKGRRIGGVQSDQLGSGSNTPLNPGLKPVLLLPSSGDVLSKVGWYNKNSVLIGNDQVPWPNCRVATPNRFTPAGKTQTSNGRRRGGATRPNRKANLPQAREIPHYTVADDALNTLDTKPVREDIAHRACALMPARINDNDAACGSGIDGSRKSVAPAVARGHGFVVTLRYEAQGKGWAADCLVSNQSTGASEKTPAHPVLDQLARQRRGADGRKAGRECWRRQGRVIAGFGHGGSLERRIDRNAVGCDEPVGLVCHADDRDKFGEHRVTHTSLSGCSAVAGDAIGAVVRDADS